MSDQNLVNEKKSLLDEVKVIQDNAKAQIKEIQEREEIVRANAEIKAIDTKAQEELKPKGERLLEINNSLIAEIDKEAGITYE